MDNVLNYLSQLQWDWNNVLDIALVTAVIYTVLVLIRGTRAVQVLRGLIVLALLVFLLSSAFNLPAFNWLV
ncbi:MAG: hypothetical protein KC443_24415, partial [Anaerolineales bacterium]|nr:hypothetical protein [Anaerolineales bacterium]